MALTSSRNGSPVVYTLHKKTVLSVMEIAAGIGYTHPSTISLLKELEKEKLIQSKKDRTDERKRLIRLTPKGKELIGAMQPVWKIMTDAITELTDTRNNLLQAITEVEEQMQRESFFNRAQRLK